MRNCEWFNYSSSIEKTKTIRTATTNKQTNKGKKLVAFYAFVPVFTSMFRLIAIRVKNNEKRKKKCSHRS